MSVESITHIVIQGVYMYMYMYFASLATVLRTCISRYIPYVYAQEGDFTIKYTYVRTCMYIYSDHNTHMQVHTIDCHTVTKGTYVPVCDFS